jgi:peptidyl-prolyl cis-trans isomerase D
MMKMLRKAAVFIMFAVLIGAFAISMGGNNYFERYSQQSVAKVGSEVITPEHYRRAYERVLENLSQRAGRRISTQEAKTFGLPNRVLQGLIQDAALDLEAHKLGVGISEAGIRQSITSAPTFQDPKTGAFSQDKYQQFLQQIGYPAPAFEQEYKGDLIRRQIRGVFDNSGVISKTMLEAFNRFGNEQRTLAYFTLAADAAGAIDAPSEDALKAFYEDRKMQFMAPEYRKVAVLSITPQTVASKIVIGEDELKAEYAAKASQYSVPERRKIELIPFKTRAAADAAYRQLKAGKDFLDVAKEAGFKQPDLDIGLVSRKEFAQKFPASQAIVDEAFSTDEGWVTKVADGPVSSAIMRILKVVPGQEKSFAESKEQIGADLAAARGKAELAKAIKAFEEDRATGVVLVDSAKKLGLPVEEVTFDRTGKAPDGKTVALSGVPVSTLVDAAFKSDVGVENEALRLPSGGYAWFEVQDIVKPRQKPVEEVKADVEAAWRKEQIRTKLVEKARELVARIEKGEAIAAVAKSVGLEAKTSKPLKREASEPGVPASAIAQAFSLTEGAAGSAISGDGATRTVFQVEKIAPPAPLNEVEARGLEQQLASQIGEDNFSGFLGGIIKTAGVSIDQKTFAAVMGGALDGGQ